MIKGITYEYGAHGRRRRYRHGFLVMLVVIFVGLAVTGCKRAVKVRAHNYLAIRVLVKRTTVPHDAYRTEKVLGWAEPNAGTTLPGTVGMDAASYRLRVFTPDGRLVAEINETQDSLEKQLRGNIWPIEIRKQTAPARKAVHSFK